MRFGVFSVSILYIFNTFGYAECEAVFTRAKRIDYIQNGCTKAAERTNIPFGAASWLPKGVLERFGVFSAAFYTFSIHVVTQNREVILHRGRDPGLYPGARARVTKGSSHTWFPSGGVM